MTLSPPNRRRVIAGTAATLALALAPATPFAQAWPAKPVRMVVPFAPGGTTDVVARMLGQRLAEVWGQPVVIENRAGAGGNVGADLVAKSPADGHTLLMASGSITINPNLYPRMPFDTKRDLVPISNVAAGPMLVVVGQKSPLRSVKDLISAAKAKPGSLNYGSAGVGSQTHLAAENLADAAGIEMQHVPYKGEAPAYTDVISGQTQLIVGNFATAAALLGPERLRALAVTGKQRSPLLPEVPTMAEAAVPGFSVTSWQGLLAPAGTPEPIVRRLHAEFVKVLRMPDVADKLAQGGSDPVASTPEEFAAFIRAENERWIRVARTAGVTPE